MGNLITKDINTEEVTTEGFTNSETKLNISDFENVDLESESKDNSDSYSETKSENKYKHWLVKYLEELFHIKEKENETSWIERYWIRFWIRWELLKKVSAKRYVQIKEWSREKYKYARNEWNSFKENHLGSKQVNPEESSDNSQNSESENTV